MSKHISPIVLPPSLTNGANEPLYLDSMGKLPTVDGSNLTGVTGGGGSLLVDNAIILKETSLKADGTTLPGQLAEVGGTWTTITGSPSAVIQSGKITSSNSSVAYAGYNLQNSTYLLSFLLHAPTTGGRVSAAIFRTTQALANGFLIQSSDNALGLYKKTGSSYTLVTSSSHPLSSAPILVKIAVNELSFTIYANDVVLYTSTSPNSALYESDQWIAVGGDDNGGISNVKVITPSPLLDKLSIREQASSAVQTINSNGSISQVIYTLPTGTITDNYTYGPYSLVEPTSVIRGNLVIGGSSGLKLVPLNWTTSTGGSFSGSLVTLASNGSGALAYTIINSANDFEVVVTHFDSASADGIVVFLDEDATEYYVWLGGGQAFLSGQYTFSSDLQTTVNSSTPTSLGATTYPVYVKMKKSGADLLIQKSSDGITYTTLLTRSGVIIGQPLYLKTLLAVPVGTGKSIDIKLYV